MSETVPVSTITVTLNACEHLRLTIESVLSQRMGLGEYIIVDGGSTDGTRALVDKFRPLFAARGTAMNVIAEPDNGIYDAMNKGLSLATGYFVNFLNAGDCYAGPEVLETVSGFIGADFVCGAAQTVDRFGNVLGRAVPAEVSTPPLFRGRSGVCHQAWFQRRETAPWYDTRYTLAADYDWIIRCARAATSGRKTDALFVSYLFGGLSQRRYFRTMVEKTCIAHRQFGWSFAVTFAARIPGSMLRARLLGPMKRRLLRGAVRSRL